MGKACACPGVPGTAGRVARTAAAMLPERVPEPVFGRGSYGYRPGRGAQDALAVCRRRCRARDWVPDRDIRAFSGLRSAFPFC
jgi:retron-type reverse transcriptase